MRYLLGTIFSLASTAALATGLVVHTSEFGVGKFHRIDNQKHAYDKNSAWLPYVLPDNAATDKALTVDNADGSVTIFYSTLDDMLAAVVQVSQSRRQPVSVLNIHGHGLPGAMWFPPTADALASSDCADWRAAASGSDQDNYDQYYSAVSVDEIQEIRMASNMPGMLMAQCTTGLDEWKSEVAKVTAFKSVLASDVQIHFLSCVVGLGSAGQGFAEGVAGLLAADGSAARVEASMDFGLGDWSMPGGMGFWDMQSETQVNHDNDIYVKDKEDKEIAQKGTIRVVTSAAAGWTSAMLADQDYMKLGFESSLGRFLPIQPQVFPHLRSVPTQLRIPGTTRYVQFGR
jgi:hypothetical protein